MRRRPSISAGALVEIELFRDSCRGDIGRLVRQLQVRYPLEVLCQGAIRCPSTSRGCLVSIVLFAAQGAVASRFSLNRCRNEAAPVTHQVQDSGDILPLSLPPNTSADQKTVGTLPCPSKWPLFKSPQNGWLVRVKRSSNVLMAHSRGVLA